MDLIIGGHAQGKKTFAKTNYPHSEIWENFHLSVKEFLNEGKSEDEIKRIVFNKITENNQLIIVCDELGCGIIPINKFDMEWREITGRLTCEIAQKAAKVFRIVCGIAQRIK